MKKTKKSNTHEEKKSSCKSVTLKNERNGRGNYKQKTQRAAEKEWPWNK